MSVAERHEFTTYRILVKKGPRKRWEHLSFSGSSSSDLARIQGRLVTATAEAPEGWVLKIQAQDVITQRTAWRDLPA